MPVSQQQQMMMQQQLQIRARLQQQQQMQQQQSVSVVGAKVNLILGRIYMLPLMLFWRSKKI